MSQPYLSEIRIMGFGYAPRYWQLCNGQTLAINQNAALFSLIGTTYGGNGVNTFMLPNLQGMVPIHMGDGFNRGQTGGEAAHILSTQEMPAHNHLVKAKNATADLNLTGVTPGPTVALAQAAAANGNDPSTPTNIYGTGGIDPNQTFAPGAIANTGSNQPHENRQPYLVLNFCIAMSGIYPSRN